MLSEKPRGGLSETRKMTKSTMEKRRRQRINNSLTELKSILSGMITHKGERFDKMEKADILEMTVKCVRQLQKQANSGDGSRSPSNPPDEDYKSGMHKCMSEVIKFISSSNFSDADPVVKTQLLDHLANKLSDSTVKSTPDTSYKRHSFSSDDSNTCCSKLADDFSDTDNDANNNINSVTGRDAVFSPPLQQQTPGAISPMFTSGTPVIPEAEPKVQPQVPQTNVPTVPLTILVPANLCSTAIGTTCVIPLNLPGVSPHQLNQPGFIPSVATSGLATSGQFTFPPASGIPLLSNQNALFATTQTSSVVPNAVPENTRTVTFSPTVITDNNNKLHHVMSTTHVNTSDASALPTATITHPLLLQTNMSEQLSKESTRFSDVSAVPSSVIKKSPSPLETVSLYNSENGALYTERGRIDDPAYRTVADSTTASPSLLHSQLGSVPTRDLVTECCQPGTFKSPPKLSSSKHQRTPRIVPYPAAPNAQIVHIPDSNHWRPW